MRFVIVTGMSGAGKSTTLKMMEDMGYFCVDNMPIPLMTKLTELLIVPNGEITKIALGLDIRSGQNLRALDQVLDELEKTKMLTRELRSELNRIFAENKEYKNLYITVLSFGFKYGIPSDADLVFDVRFLPNPYYIDELRPQSGNDKPVRDYVMNNDISKEFLKKLVDMVEFLIPNYVAEGKNQLVIAIGCTGGKHRSVTLANELYERLSVAEKEYGVRKEHRDIEKDAITKAK